MNPINPTPWTSRFLEFAQEVKSTNKNKELQKGDILAICCLYLRVGEDVDIGHMGQISIDLAGDTTIPKEAYAMLCAQAAKIILKTIEQPLLPLPKVN